MKSKVLALFVFVLSFIVATTGINSRAEAVSMQIPDGASMMNVVNVLNLSKKGGSNFQEGTRYTGSGE